MASTGIFEECILAPRVFALINDPVDPVEPGRTKHSCYTTSPTGNTAMVTLHPKSNQSVYNSFDALQDNRFINDGTVVFTPQKTKST